MIVGTVARKLTRCSMTSRRNSAHEHEMVAHRQADDGSGEAGVVAERYRDQVDVVFLGAERVADHRRHPAITAGLDEFRSAGAPAGGHRFPRRGHRLGQRCVRTTTGSA